MLVTTLNIGGRITENFNHLGVKSDYFRTTLNLQGGGGGGGGFNNFDFSSHFNILLTTLNLKSQLQLKS